MKTDDLDAAVDTFAADVMSCIGAEPVLVNDIVARLRHADLASKRRWQNVRVEAVESALRAGGACLRYRTHGAGIAVYAGAQAFVEVQTRHGLRPVYPYR